MTFVAARVADELLLVVVRPVVARMSVTAVRMVSYLAMQLAIHPVLLVREIRQSLK